jgi:hypothetical protein
MLNLSFKNNIKSEERKTKAQKNYLIIIKGTIIAYSCIIF